MILSPSPSVKIQIMGKKVCLRCKSIVNNMLGVVNKLLKASNVLLYYLKWTQVSNLNFHWRWWDRIQVTFLNLFYFIQQTFSSSDSSIQSFFFSLQLLFRMIAHHNANPFRLDWQPNILITVSASHTAVPKRKHSKWPEHNSNVQIGSRGVSSRHTHSIKCDDSNKQ